MKKLFSLLMLALALPSFAGDIYVSTNGNDSNSGTSDHPVQTLRKALKIAREWRRTNDSRTVNGITIHIAEGAYEQDETLYLRPEDSGEKGSPTVIKSDIPGKAVISGGMSLDSWSKDKDYYHTRMLIAGKPLLTRSLWIDGRKSIRANALGDGVMERMIDFNKQDETITIPASSLLKYGIKSIDDAPQMEMIVHQRWAIAILRVKDIKFDGDKAILSFHNPESRWEFSHPWPQPVINEERGSSSFALVGAKQFMQDNEWWQDYSTGEIYVKGYNQLSNIVVPRLSNILLAEGTSTSPIHDIKFEGVTFSYSAWNRPMTQGHVTLQGGFPIIDAYKLTENEGLPWAPNLENQAWVARPEAAVTVRWAENVDFVNCEFTHLASTGLDYEIGCHDITIKGNKFEDIGGNALLCGSFGEGALEAHRPYEVSPSNAYTENFEICGNTIHDATNEDWGAVAIGCGYVRDFNIHHNTVSHVNYSGICVGWGWTPHDSGMRNNRIENNKVSDFARQLYDAGGIYTLSAQPNSFIRNNTITDLHDAPYATNYRAFYIYFDAETDGFTVNGNVMPEVKLGYNNPGPNMVIEQ